MDLSLPKTECSNGYACKAIVWKIDAQSRIRGEIVTLCLFCNAQCESQCDLNIVITWHLSIASRLKDKEMVRNWNTRTPDRSEMVVFRWITDRLSIHEFNAQMCDLRFRQENENLLNFDCRATNSYEFIWKSSRRVVKNIQLKATEFDVCCLLFFSFKFCRCEMGNVGNADQTVTALGGACVTDVCSQIWHLVFFLNSFQLYCVLQPWTFNAITENKFWTVFSDKMPPLENEEVVATQPPGDEDENRNEKTLSGPIIGIIYPPPEVRSILNLKNIATKNNKINFFKRFSFLQNRIYDFSLIFLNHF